jgi:putative salt-induced outer membrane protein YdiY
MFQWMKYGGWNFEWKFSNNTKHNEKRSIEGNEKETIETNSCI